MRQLKITNKITNRESLALDKYLNDIGKIPMLNADEEADLARRIKQGDTDALDKLTKSNLRFVVSVAKQYQNQGLSLSDLINEGNVGLMKAVKRFDPEKGVRLVSFAVHWIKAEIHEYVLRNWRIVKIATTKAQRKLFFNLRSAKKQLSWLSNDEVHAVAADLGVDVAEVRRMEGRLSSVDVGFDADTDDERGPVAPVHYLEDHSADPALLLESDNLEESNHQNLSLALSELDERSRDILQSRWLGDTKATLHDLADRYGVSAERIRQLEQAAMKKLRAAMEA
jgi:RNA polymerase sigma-32 factor